MNSSFESIKFDLKLADIELMSFKAWLADVKFVSEAVIVTQSRRAVTWLVY